MASRLEMRRRCLIILLPEKCRITQSKFACAEFNKPNDDGYTMSTNRNQATGAVAGKEDKLENWKTFRRNYSYPPHKPHFLWSFFSMDSRTEDPVDIVILHELCRVIAK